MNTLERPRRVVVLPKWSTQAAAHAAGHLAAHGASHPAPPPVEPSATQVAPLDPVGEASAAGHAMHPAAPQPAPADSLPMHGATEPGTGQLAVPARSHRAHLVAGVLLGAALLLSLGDQCWQRWAEHQQLQATHAQLQLALDKAQQLRTSLDALAADTQRLADGGNLPAQQLVQELRRRGITIHTTAIAPGR